MHFTFSKIGTLAWENGGTLEYSSWVIVLQEKFYHFHSEPKTTKTAFDAKTYVNAIKGPQSESETLTQSFGDVFKRFFNVFIFKQKNVKNGV